MDPPTPEVPAFIKCPGCDGRIDGCRLCVKDGRPGELEITRCPLDDIAPDAMECLELVALFREGLPPVAGGTLDQTESFLQAALFVWSDQNEAEAQTMRRRDHGE